MGYESYLRKRRISVSSRRYKPTGKHRHPLRLFACKVVDVFSFHLQIFHWFIAPPSRRYFQGHSPWENPTPLLNLRSQSWLFWWSNINISVFIDYLLFICHGNNIIDTMFFLSRVLECVNLTKLFHQDYFSRALDQIRLIFYSIFIDFLRQQIFTEIFYYCCPFYPFLKKTSWL
jgi:hypothetical protein